MRRFRNAIARIDGIASLVRDLRSVRSISRRGPGYSGLSHYRFFRHVLSGSRPPVDSVLLLGVYFARDLMMISDLAKTAPRNRPGTLGVTGVDKFADEFCEDWPEEKKELSWERAGFGAPPSLERARQMVTCFCEGVTVRLVHARAEEFLEECPAGRYGWVYIDTSHDYESTRRLIELARRVLRPPGILSGDDYSNEGTWGVENAVKESLASHLVWENRIWYTQTS